MPMLIMLAIDTFLSAFFWIALVRNWASWDAASRSSHGMGLAKLCLQAMKRPGMIHDFRSWIQPAMLGHPLLFALIGGAALAIQWERAAFPGPPGKDLDFVALSLFLYAMPCAAILLAPRDKSPMGIELTRQRELRGVSTSKERARSLREKAELADALPSVGPSPQASKKRL